jgi:hypothetical protein
MTESSTFNERFAVILITNAPRPVRCELHHRIARQGLAKLRGMNGSADVTRNPSFEDSAPEPRESVHTGTELLVEKKR